MDLNSTKSLNLGYPFNYEYPNSISFSGVQDSFLIAYGSSNLIIVLTEGKPISAVLHGHEATICTVSFEIRGPHILSCDITGKCIFWHYQESIWENSRMEQLTTPLISVSWYTTRDEICYSSKDGLFHCSLTNFGSTAEQFCTKSSFCTFNFDGTLLASHNNKSTVKIFQFSPKNSLKQFLKHPSSIVTFDFHPFLPSFLTIAKDHILRIWKQSISSGFACTVAIEVPFSGFFVRNTFFYSNKSEFDPKKLTTILFIDHQYKFYKLKIDENGLIKNTGDNNQFKNAPFSDDFGFRAAFKTNIGTESIIVSKTKISIVCRHQTHDLLFNSDIECQKKT